MVCARCAHAADNHLPADQHCSQTCGGPGRRCDCQHRTDHYHQQPATNNQPSTDAHPAIGFTPGATAP